MNIIEFEFKSLHTKIDFDRPIYNYLPTNLTIYIFV